MPPLDLISRIDGWATRAPNRVAHCTGGRIITYAELVRQSDALAKHLAAQLPSEHSPVAIRGHKESELLVGFLASVQARHPYIPLDISIPTLRVERSLSTSGA